MNTHRCHDRAFLLKFARDRDAYRVRLRQHLREFDLHLLDYCLTSKHVHLLVDAPEREEVSGLWRVNLRNPTPDTVASGDGDLPKADNVWALEESAISYGQKTG